MTQPTLAELEAGLEEIRRSPRADGLLRRIVRRPERAQREVLDTARLDVDEGLVGDNWLRRGNSRTADGSAHPEMQLTLMSTRVIGLLAPDESRRPLAGDQLYVDMDLSIENLPPETRLGIGAAIIAVTRTPHTGCQKFVERFGLDAMKFINTPTGHDLRLRGVNTRVVRSGTIAVGDVLRKIEL